MEYDLQDLYDRLGAIVQRSKNTRVVVNFKKGKYPTENDLLLGFTICDVECRNNVTKITITND